MYYFYKIENRINNHKYIGITTDPKVRKRRHFGKLEKNEHFNPHLQLAFNKYGKDNFFFEIIEEMNTTDVEKAYAHEQELISFYDTVNNGYNCNPGGKWTGPKGRFTEQEVMWIRAACYYNSHIVAPLSRYFNCPHATVNNIAIGRNYKPYCAAFDNLPEEEKKQIYEDFCSVVDINILKADFSINKSRRWSKEEVLAILYCDETRFITFAELARKFNKGDVIKNRYFREVREGHSYKDYVALYKTLTSEEKDKIRAYILEI